MESLYERIGGEAALMAAVEIFYRRVLSDEVTRPFFDDVDMGAQARKLVGFMAWAFGGPEEYKGRSLRASHAKLVEERGLNDVHFDAVSGHLKSTLDELGVPDELAQEALALVAATRDEVLGR